MADLALGISGRIEEGETLQAWAMGPVTGLQWQALVNGVWVNVGAANSQTYVIPPGAAGSAYRLVGTSAEGDVFSTVTGLSTVDTKKSTAPVLSGPSLSGIGTEGPGPRSVFSWLTFSDTDRGNYGGGSLLLQDSTAAAYGGDGHDVLSIRFDGTQAGQFSYDAATREVKFAFTSSNVVAIGTLDSTLNGNAADLKVTFNANATAAVVDALINNLQFSNNDDSPTFERLFTLRVTDPSGASAQRVTTVSIENTPDAPVFTSAASAAIDENQAAAAVVAAIDPDREAGQPQGIAYSLAAGDGDTDNARFEVDAASGALRFKAAPDFEDAAHAPLYSVRVRATDSGGSTTEQLVTVTVRDVNEAPVAQALSATAQEDGAPIAFGASFSEPDANDSHTIALDTTGTVGAVTLQGTTFTYDPGAHFQSLGQGETATDTFTYTVTDAGGLSSTGTATVTISGTNDAPVIDASQGAVGDVTEPGADGTGPLPGVPVASGTLLAGDIDGDALAWAAGASGQYGTLAIDPSTGAWTYVLDSGGVDWLAAGQTLTDTLLASVSDGHGGAASQSITITIHGANDAPIIQPGEAAATVVESSPDGRVLLDPAVAGGIYGIATDQEGHLLIVGQSDDPWGRALWRFNADGSADTSFGNGGSVFIESSTAFEQVAVDTAGRYVVGGQVNNAENGSADVGLARYLHDGSLDTSFGNGGVVSFDFAAGYDYATQVIATADGGLLVQAEVQLDPQGYAEMALIRLDANGQPDAAFGDGGMLVFPTPAGMSSNYQTVLDGQGRILLWGNAQSSDPDNPGPLVQITRLLADGSTDTSFGNQGSVTQWLDGWYANRGDALAVDADGRIVLGWGAYTSDPGYHAMLTRFDDSGALDTAFGNAGTVSTGLVMHYGGSFTMGVDAQGRVVVSPHDAGSDWNPQDFTVARFNSDGTADTSFGAGGVVATDMGGDDHGEHLIVGADGSILVAGNTAVMPGEVVALARYNPDGSPDTGFGSGMPDAQAWGWLGGSDPDSTSTLTWSGSADGVYGQFTIEGGFWSYRLDNARAATQALDASDLAIDTFTVTLTDEFGATATQQVVVTVVGTYDPPAP